MDKEPPNDPPKYQLPRLGYDNDQEKAEKRWHSYFDGLGGFPPQHPDFAALQAEMERHEKYMAGVHPDSIQFDDAKRQWAKVRVKIEDLVYAARAAHQKKNGVAKTAAEELEAQREAARKRAAFDRRAAALDAGMDARIEEARRADEERRAEVELERAGREGMERRTAEEREAAREESFATIGKEFRRLQEGRGKVVELRPTMEKEDSGLGEEKIDWRARMRLADELKKTAVPDLVFRITGFWPKVWLSQLNGDGGSGKTSLLTQVFSCLSAGAPIFGRPTVQTKVMLFSSEEDDEIAARRLNKTPNVGRFPVFNLLDWPEDYDLCRPKRDGSVEERPFYRILREIIGDTGPELIGLDHVGDLLPVNENDKAQVNDALQLLRKLHAEFGVDFILTQHMSRLGQAAGRRDAGTPQWHNKARYRLALYPPGLAEGAGEDETLAALIAQARTLEIMKDNYGNTVGTKVHLLRQGWNFVEEKGEVVRARGKSLVEALTEFVAARQREDAGIMWPAAAQAPGSLIVKFREPLGKKAPAFDLVAEAVAELEKVGVLAKEMVRNTAGVAKPYWRPA